MRLLIPAPSLRSAALVVTVFLVSFVAGNAIAPKAHDSTSIFSQVGLPKLERMDFNRNSFSPRPKSPAESRAKFFEYVVHNGLAALMITALGLCLFFFPAIAISILGVACGFLFWHTNSPMVYARLLLPHGVVELPATFYVAAVAQSCGWKWVWAGSGKRKREFMNQAGIACRCFLVAIPLLVIAAILEAYVP